MEFVSKQSELMRARGAVQPFFTLLSILLQLYIGAECIAAVVLQHKTFSTSKNSQERKYRSTPTKGVEDGREEKEKQIDIYQPSKNIPHVGGVWLTLFQHVRAGT